MFWVATFQVSVWYIGGISTPRGCLKFERRHRQWILGSVLRFWSLLIVSDETTRSGSIPQSLDILISALVVVMPFRCRVLPLFYSSYLNSHIATSSKIHEVQRGTIFFVETFQKSNKAKNLCSWLSLKKICSRRSLLFAKHMFGSSKHFPQPNPTLKPPASGSSNIINLLWSWSIHHPSFHPVIPAPMADAGSSLVTAWSLHVFAPFVSLQSMFHQHIPVLGPRVSRELPSSEWLMEPKAAGWTQWMHLEDHWLRLRGGKTLPFSSDLIPCLANFLNRDD